MSKICDLCHRGPTKMTTRSHSNIRSRRWVYVNLQTKRIDGDVMHVCTRCMKTRERKLQTV